MAVEMLENEVWRSVSGRESEYDVSSIGRVRSLPRFRLGKGGYPTRVAGRILKQFRDAGYAGLSLGKGRFVYVHRLVAEAFIHNPESLPEVNHRDGDKWNNCVGNLEWVSHAGNGRHAAANGLLAVGSAHGMSKLTEPDIHAIRQQVMVGESCVKIAKAFNVHPETIRSVLIGRTWSHVK